MIALSIRRKTGRKEKRGRNIMWPNGSDKNPGTEAQPFVSLAAARDALRACGKLSRESCTVIIHGGTYRLKEPLKLNQVDSGAKGAEVMYRAVKGEN